MDMQMGMARAHWGPVLLPLGNSQAICESKLIILGRINRDSSLLLRMSFFSGCDDARAQHSCVYLQEREYAIWSGADPPTSSNDVHAAPAK